MHPRVERFMSLSTTEIGDAALNLPERERADLAARLIDSLDPAQDEAADAAWAAEIQRRMDELDKGLVQPIPWEEARRMILEARRSATSESHSQPGSPGLSAGRY